MIVSYYGSLDGHGAFAAHHSALSLPLSDCDITLQFSMSLSCRALAFSLNFSLPLTALSTNLPSDDKHAKCRRRQKESAKDG